MELKFQCAREQYVLTLLPNPFLSVVCLLPMSMSSFGGTASNGRMISNELEMVWKEAVMA